MTEDRIQTLIESNKAMIDRHDSRLDQHDRILDGDEELEMPGLRSRVKTLEKENKAQFKFIDTLKARWKDLSLVLGALVWIASETGILAKLF